MVFGRLSFQNYISLEDGYHHLIVWTVRTKPVRFKMFRPSYGVISEGPNGYSQEVGLAGLVNDF